MSSKNENPGAVDKGADTPADLAAVYTAAAKTAADALMADPNAASKILLSIARTDGRTVARRAIRAALVAELADARRAFRGGK